MQEKRILDVEDLMIDYAEMTSFDFESLDYKQARELEKVTESEYSKLPSAFKFGKFDVLDMLHSFIVQKT